MEDNKAIQTIIIDDDPGMRLLLLKIISRDNRFVYAGDAEDGAKGYDLFVETRPKLVFLDVDMPVENGIECAKKIFDIEPKTILIFVTAHEQYMPEAFEVYAFDYVIKPFKPDRIYKTLDRIYEIYCSDESVQPVLTLDDNVRKDRLLIKDKEGIIFIDMKSVILIQREERNTVIYTSDGGKYVTSEGLGELQDRLDSAYLIRSHKSYIINITKITNIYNYGRWTYLAKFQNTKHDALINYEKYSEIEKLYGIK